MTRNKEEKIAFISANKEVIDFEWNNNDEWGKLSEYISDFCFDHLSEYFDCGQGYYTEEAEFLFKIEDDLYEARIAPEIGSARQDRGERLYWVESIREDHIKIEKLDESDLEYIVNQIEKELNSLIKVIITYTIPENFKKRFIHKDKPCFFTESPIEGHICVNYTTMIKPDYNINNEIL